MLIVGVDKNSSDVKYSQKDCVHMSGRIVSEVRNGPELSLSGDYADESTGSPGK